MKKSSIHFKRILPNSEVHNKRLIVPDYAIEGNEDIPKNYSKSSSSVAEKMDEIKKIYAQRVRRKWHINTNPIREAVVNLDQDSFKASDGKHTIKQCIINLNRLCAELKDLYGIEIFQTHIHFDEGKKTPHGEVLPLWERNIHAHLVFDWQNKETGKMYQISPQDMQNIQTITAKHLCLERGSFGSKLERLEHYEFRGKMEKLDLQIETTKIELRQLQEELEKKKLKTSNLMEELNNWKMKSKAVEFHYQTTLKEVNNLLKSNPILQKYWQENKQKYQTQPTR